MSKVRLGDLRPLVQAWAEKHGAASDADAIRQLVAKALGADLTG